MRARHVLAVDAWNMDLHPDHGPSREADALTRLAAIEAIRTKIYMYCRAADRMDRDLALELWHPGGLALFEGAFDGTATDFVEWLYDPTRTSRVTSAHHVTNILIDVRDDQAVTESYILAIQRVMDVDEDRCELVTGRYVDRWRCIAGVWGVDHRRYIRDFTLRLLPPNASTSTGQGWSSRSIDDPSYAAFQSLRHDVG